MGIEKCGLHPGLLLEEGGRGQGLGQTTRTRKVIPGPGDFEVPDKRRFREWDIDFVTES